MPDEYLTDLKPAELVRRWVMHYIFYKATWQNFLKLLGGDIGKWWIL